MGRKLQIITLLFFIVCGCKKEDANNAPLKAIEVGEIKSHIVSLEQANKIAVLHSMYPNALKRSANSDKLMGTFSTPYVAQQQKPGKSVKSTFRITYDQSQATFYIINYKEGGFAIISGDDRTVPILAFSEKNQFPIHKNVKYPGGLVFWLKSNHEFIKELRVKNGKQSDFVKSSWKDIEMKSQLSRGNYSVLNDFPPCAEENVGEYYSTDINHGPLLSTTWYQGYGFNNAINLGTFNCVSDPNGQPPAGCVAISMGQIMYYYQHPTSYNWSAMPIDNSGSPEAARLIKDIGMAVGTDYACSGSSAFTSNNDDVFIGDFGYSNAVYNSSYDFHTVKNDILNNKPVLLGAIDSNEGWWIFDFSGHQWVADGYQEHISYECREVIPESGGSEQYRRPPVATHTWWPVAEYGYFHMNWGWGGDYNDWYSTHHWAVNGHMYDKGLVMVTNITP